MEALSASMKVEELLNEYNLTLTEIECRSDVFETLEINTGKTQKNEVYNVVSAIAYLTDTKVWINKGFKINYVFFGSKKDIEVANFLYDLLLNAIQFEIKQYKKSKSYKNNPNHGKTKITSFKIGINYRLSTRLREMKDNRKKENLEQGLVLYDKMNIVEEKFREMFNIDLKSNKIKSTVKDYSSYMKGTESADKININPGIKANSKKNNILTS